MSNDCPFCRSNGILRGEIVAENDIGYVVRSDDPILTHSVMIIPTRHVATPFDLTDDEWWAMRSLLATGKRIIDAARPDGYNVGWNVGEAGGQSVPHAHLHLIARFADEPLAGQGIRHALKQPANTRPATTSRTPD